MTAIALPRMFMRSLQALWLLGLVAAGLSHAGEKIDLRPEQVSPHVWYFRGESGAASQENKGYMSNAGFVVTKDQVVVFDSLGSPALGEGMIRAIRNITPLPIKLVIVSHYHADHFYGLQAFKALGAQVWAHVGAKEYLASDIAKERLAQRRRDLAPWVDERTRLIAPDHLFSGDQALTRGGVELRLIDVHGSHAPDDVMLFLPGEKVLFAGDLFFSGRLPFVGDANTARWLTALDHMLESKPAVVIPGHGNASADPLPDIAATREYLVFLRKTMGDAVADLVPFDEVYQRTDWSRFAGQRAFEAANRLNAYNVYIQMEQESLRK
ncbi:MBL fold metallo-hydrolase [Denitratisoma sp. agr-D3]